MSMNALHSHAQVPMARKLILSVVTLILALPLSAQELENKQAFLDQFFLDPTLREAYSPLHQPMGMTEGFPRKDIDSTVDVLTYELWMDWVDALLVDRSLRGDRKVEARLKARLKIIDGIEPAIGQIRFDAIGLIIDSVLVDEQSTTFETLTREVVIDLPQTITGGDSITVDIYYALSRDNRGFYAYAGERADTLGLLEHIAFTFSQPEDARRWYPCNDKPFDKAVFTTHTRAPHEYTVVSNGERIDSTDDTDTTSWQTWYEPTPKPSYLLAISASKYHRYDQSVTLKDGRTIPIFNYHWLADHDGENLNAVRALANIPAMFEPFEEAFGPYPLETYGHVTVSPIQFGGMEHQTMSTINRVWLRGNAEAGYAHELIHQWIGDEVTCATWGDIWLNEGGASFGEAVWYEHKSGPTAYIVHLLGKRARYMNRGLDEPPVYDIPIGMIFNNGTTYSKSSWVYHMMRRLVGDEAFFDAMKVYIQRYSFGAAQTVDLMNVLQEQIPNPPVPWETYFDQWLYQAGHPIYSSVARVNAVPDLDGSYRTYVTVRQVQPTEGIPEAFVMPVTIRLEAGQERMDTTVLIDQRVFDLQLNVPFQADTMIIDPNFDILCQRSAAVATTVEEESTFDDAVRFTSAVPVVRGTPLQMAIPPASTIRVVTLDGRQLFTGMEPSGLTYLDTSSWPLGAVAVVIEHDSRILARTIPVIE